MLILCPNIGVEIQYSNTKFSEKSKIFWKIMKVHNFWAKFSEKSWKCIIFWAMSRENLFMSQCKQQKA